jgi:hypothetical protein
VSRSGDVVVEVTRTEDLYALYARLLECKPGSRLVVRLPAGPIGNPALPTAVALAPSGEAGVPDIELVVAGPSASGPAVLENVTFALSARAVTVADVLVRGGGRTVVRAVIGETLLFDSVIVAGIRHDNPQDEAIVEVAVVPGRDGTVQLHDTWLVDNTCWSGRPAGLAVRAGSGAGFALSLRRSGFVANSLRHELAADGARSVSIEDGAIVGPAQPEPWAGAAIAVHGTPVVLRRTLVAPGGGRLLVDADDGPPDVQDEPRARPLEAARSLRAADISSTVSVHRVI